MGVAIQGVFPGRVLTPPLPQVPREAPREPPGRAAERAALEMQRQNRGYRLVESDEEEEGPSPARDHARDHAQDEPRPRRRHLRRRRRSESPPEAAAAPPSPPPPPEPPEEPEEEWEASERERLRDLRERDAFAERLSPSSRNAPAGNPRAAEVLPPGIPELRKRSHRDYPFDAVTSIPELRKRSRREYLAKREREKLEELELEIQDEELLFGEEALS
ncbi:pre-mRNA-splicing factor ATP-dependent RNA helicase DHX16-like, partial [Malurus melanocephalus]|uniref:pre-mRNA-splicing factor ATP-dependent RNA helicase DHX16-like n=1 Tax=Malurus melanocephalus TaxID=175006 RepID=UPI0025482F23